MYATAHTIKQQQQQQQQHPPPPPLNGGLHASGAPPNSHEAAAIAQQQQQQQQHHNGPGMIVAAAAASANQQAVQARAQQQQQQQQQRLPSSAALNETTVSTWLAIGSLAESLGDIERATASYNSALRHSPNNPDILVKIANTYRSKISFLRLLNCMNKLLISMLRMVKLGDYWVIVT